MTACKSNLKNLGTALEMYSTDFSGKYPDSLAPLTPNYLKTLPDCPAAKSVSYQASFGPGGLYNTWGFQDYYYLQCAGSHHKAVSVPDNYPQYSCVSGLIER